MRTDDNIHRQAGVGAGHQTDKAYPLHHNAPSPKAGPGRASHDDAPAGLCRALNPDHPLTRIGLPVLTFLILVFLGAALFRHERADVTDDIQNDTTLIREQLARRMEKALSDEFRPLRRTAKDMLSGLLATPQKFHLHSRSVQSQIAEYERMVWLGADGVCIGDSAEPPESSMVGVDLAKSDAWKPLAAARNDEIAVASTEPGAWFFVMPVRADSESPLRGTLAARVKVSHVIEQLIDADTGDLFAMELRDDRDRVAVMSHQSEPCPIELRVDEPVKMIGKTWRLRVWPKPAFVAQKSMREAWSALAGMSLLAIVAAICVWQAIEHWRRNRTHASAIEALNDIAAAITGSPEQSQLALERVTRLAAGMVAMPIFSLNLFDASDDSITVVYRGGLQQDVRNRYHLSELRANSACFQSGKPMFVPDLDRDPMFSNSPLRELRIRSLAVIPLIVQGLPIGTISLFDRRTRVFSRPAVRMATLWAAQAAIIVRNAELYRRIEAARRLQARMISQRETLYRVNLHIQSSASVEEALQRIADLSPGALDIDVCAVAQPTGEPSEFRVLSVTTLDPPFPLPTGAIVRCEHAARAVETQHPAIIADTRPDASIALIDRSIGSALYVPLVVGRNSIGVMALYRREPGPFPDEQVQLAELFAAKAAVAIENSRLLDQTRRDADAKAVLLRELNHRVKNNLAGIAGLLSTSPANLPDNARYWLDRVIERIEGMARVHGLFVNGSIAVTLPELIEKSVGAIMSIRPPSVNIELDLQGDDIKLRSDRSVTLAMVLHELCFNALRHGVQESGTITVRSRAANDGTVTINVIDDGGADDLHYAAPATAVAARTASSITNTGMGLSLVRGLVGRELHGEFTIDMRSGGGTIATIVFSGAERKRL